MSDAPRVTISDPNHPGEPVDVMSSGDERDPWKPGRRTWSVIGVLVLVAAIVITVGAVQQHNDTERAKDKAALAQVRLTTTDPFDQSQDADGFVQLGLSNNGSQPVTVRSLHVLAPGYAVVPLGKTIEPFGNLTVSVPDTRTCGPEVLTPPATMRVALTTSRGQRLDQDVQLFASGGAQLANAAQLRCRYFSPGRALDAIVSDVVKKGSFIDLTLNLANAGRLPLRVLSLGDALYLSITNPPRYPLALKPEPQELEARTGIDLRLHLRILDCDLAHEGVVANQGEPLAGLAVGVQGPDTDVVESEVFLLMTDDEFLALLKDGC